MATHVIQDLYEIAKTEDSDVEWNDTHDSFTIHMQNVHNSDYWISIEVVEDSVVYKAPLVKRYFLPQLLEIAAHEQKDTTLSLATPMTQEDDWVYLQGVHDIHTTPEENKKRYRQKRASMEKTLFEYNKMIQEQLSFIQKPILEEFEKYTARLLRPILNGILKDINNPVQERNLIMISQVIEAVEEHNRAMLLPFFRNFNQELSRRVVDGLSKSIHELSTEQLWTIIKEGLGFPLDLDEQMQKLIQKGKKEELTPEEQQELNNLMDLYDKYVVLRAKTITELQEGGEEIQTYLQENTPA